MRVVFLGSPSEVVAPLAALLAGAPAAGHEVVGVVSQPARPAGRKRVLTDPPVAVFAKDKGVPLLQPQKASDPEFLAAFAAWKPDVAITAAYGQILTDAFLAVPKRATINIHPSLLPLYRGATPVPAALMAGDSETGVTILFTVKALDAGAIILQERVNLAPTDTAGPLTQSLFERSGAMLLKSLDLLADPEFAGTPQDETQVTFCKKLSKADGEVDWHAPASEVVNRYRAFDPWPGSYTFLGGLRVGLSRMELVTTTHAAEPGTASFSKTDGGLLIACGKGSVIATEVKPAGSKQIPAAAFWNGLQGKDAVRFTRA